MAPTIKQLIAKPFGKPAYWEKDILSELCKSTPTKPLLLENLILVCNHRVTGLTYIEPTQPECQQALIKSGDVIYRGILTLKKQWLTEDGRRALEKELRQRDIQARGREGVGDVESSELTISDVFRVGKPKVWVQGIKPVPAVFMKAGQRIAPKGLYLMTDLRREYEVVSMGADTAIRSQLYFTRYRLTRELEDLVTISQDKDGNPVQLSHRTVEWFVSQYIKHKYDREDTRIAKANLRTLFATHCEWLTKDQENVIHKRSRLIDVPSWRRWHLKWKNQSLRDDDTDVDEQAAAAISDEDLMDVDDESPPPVRRGVKRVPISRMNSRKRVRVVSESSREGSPDLQPYQPVEVSDEGESSGLEYIDPSDLQPQPLHNRESTGLEYIDPNDPVQYYRHPTPEEDEGFIPDYEIDSPPQSDWEEDSDDSLQVVRDGKTAPEVLAAIPAVLKMEPRLPRPGRSWYCPVVGCTHEINMYNLPDDDKIAEVLTKEARDWIKTQAWTWNDPNLVGFFMDLVASHYQDHLDLLGIKTVGEGNNQYYQWKHPAEHPSEHAKIILRKVTQVVRHVKIEEAEY